MTRMAIQLKTKNEQPLNDKPRVFFACHPAEHTRYFEGVCAAIFRTHDVALYYDDGEGGSAEERYDALARCQLLVVPVTRLLLTTPNPAMDEVVAAAQREQTPLLPLMMEPGLDSLYAREDRFGERQYLTPGNTDAETAFFEQTLEQFLHTVLISGDVMADLRRSFRGYVFLSYRKKDRRHARQLLRYIHSLPGCEDVAVWFDEFLTPGESFEKNIDEALQKSQLFLLLVTPQVLEETDGVPNYVVRQEYPAARRAGLPILAVQMEPTDPAALAEAFPGLPACVAPEEEAFAAQLRQAMTGASVDESPEHDLRMGLAYLRGVDVEIDHARAIRCVTRAAEAGWDSAIACLRNLYNGSMGDLPDLPQAAHWAKKYVGLCEKRWGAKHPETLEAAFDWALILKDMGDYRAAGQVMAQVCVKRKETLGLEHPDTLNAYNEITTIYDLLGMVDKFRQFSQAVYNQSRKSLGEDHPHTLSALYRLADACHQQGEYRQALELAQRAFDRRRQVLGEDAQDTIASLALLATCLVDVGELDKAVAMGERCYQLIKEQVGDEHPDTLNALGNLAMLYVSQGDHRRALALMEDCYERQRQVLGDDHPNTAATLNALAFVLNELEDYRRALPLLQQAYRQQTQTLGEKHPDLLYILNNLATAYLNTGSPAQAIMHLEKGYRLSKEILGKDHPHTLTILSNLAEAHNRQGNREIARELIQKCYDGRVRTLGETHPDTLTTADWLKRL